MVMGNLDRGEDSGKKRRQLRREYSSKLVGKQIEKMEIFSSRPGAVSSSNFAMAEGRGEPICRDDGKAVEFLGGRRYVRNWAAALKINRNDQGKQV
jgi:hypothetical protein